MEKITQIKAIYCELQGYLSQAPKEESINIYTSEIWQQINSTIDELNSIVGDDYDCTRFKIRSKIKGNDKYAQEIIDSTHLRQQLNGLIMRLYGIYFSNETSPFSGAPATNISLNQQQNQDVRIHILLETQSLVDKLINEATDSTEKSFLEKIKKSLSSIQDISGLINLILSTGSSMGLAVEQILKIFK